MPDEQAYGLTAKSLARISDAVRRVEREPRPTGDSRADRAQRPDTTVFVVASDPSDYDTVDAAVNLPLGYRGHVIGYSLYDGFDLADLPVVPSLDTLLAQAENDGSEKGVKDWVKHKWVEDHKDDLLGRPVLINVCAYAKGLFFRGQRIVCKRLPGFRYADVYRGETAAYAAPTWGELNGSETLTYDPMSGWCGVSPGYTQARVTLEGEFIDPASDDEDDVENPDPDALYAEAVLSTQTLAFGSQELDLQLQNPEHEHAEPKVWVFAKGAQSAGLSVGDETLAVWNHLLFRMELTTPLGVRFRNDHSEAVPGFSVMRITGTAEDADGNTVLKCAQPNTYGSQYLHVVNGPKQIEAGEYGWCVRPGDADVVRVKYVTADGTPAVGEKWGPRDASWKLRKPSGGFQIVGDPDTETETVLAVRAPMLSFIGKTDASHAKSATGTISIWAGTTLGSESDTTLNMTSVYNRFADVDTTKWVRCSWNNEAQQWELTAAEC